MKTFQISEDHPLSPRFAIGTKFLSSGKNKRICTVVNHLFTFDSHGEFQKLRYVATHDFLGQKITDHDVLGITIAKNLIQEDATS